MTSFRRRILVFKRGSRNPLECILLFWNTINTSFDMPLAREECVMLVLLLEVFCGLAHDVKLKRFCQSLKNKKPRKRCRMIFLSWQPHRLVMMYHFNFYNIEAQFAWDFQTCEVRNVLILGIVVLWFRWNWCFSNVKFLKSSLCNKLGPYRHMVVKGFWQQSSWWVNSLDTGHVNWVLEE